MTTAEIVQLRALFRCRFGYRTFDSRFVRNLNAALRHDPAQRLTAKQRHTLRSILYRYRRQLARLLPPALQVTEPPKDWPAPDIPDQSASAQAQEYLDLPNFHPQRELF